MLDSLDGLTHELHLLTGLYARQARKLGGGAISDDLDTISDDLGTPTPPPPSSLRQLAAVYLSAAAVSRGARPSSLLLSGLLLIQSRIARAAVNARWLVTPLGEAADTVGCAAVAQACKQLVPACEGAWGAGAAAGVLLAARIFEGHAPPPPCARGLRRR